MKFEIEKQKYVIKIPSNIHRFAEDAMKYSIILSTFHIMLYSKDGKSGRSTVFVEQFIYVMLALAIYWLIIDKLISFE